MVTLIDTLQEISSDPDKLENYLDDNFHDVYDFFYSEKYTVLLSLKGRIEHFILFNQSVYRTLDFRKVNNLAFICLLLDISERLGLLTAFNLLYGLLDRHQFQIGKRLEAAALYLVDINSSEDYLS